MKTEKISLSNGRKERYVMSTALKKQYTPALEKQNKTLNPYHNVVAVGPLLDTVYEMRYESYSAKRFIASNDSKVFSDEYDGSSNCTSYLTFKNKKVVGSIRGCMYDPLVSLPIPIADVFHNEIVQAIGFDCSMLEVNKFVISPYFQRRGGIVARFMIFDNVVSAALEQKANYLVVGVREEHIKFYCSMFGFELASDLRLYPDLQFKTALMICYDVVSFKQKLSARLGKYRKIEPSIER